MGASLSTPAKVGIVIGCLVIVGAAAAAAVLVKKKKKGEDVEGARAVLDKAREPHDEDGWTKGGSLEFSVLLDEQGAKDLSILLRHNIIKPERIALYGNRADGGIGDAGATALAQALLKDDTTLTSLTMTNQNIGVDGATELADALAKNTTLTRFAMYHDNLIGDGGAAALALALEANKDTLEHLDLDDCSIGDTGMAALAGALAGHQALTSLYISRNKFGEQGVRAVATMLQTNTTLQTLYLQRNQISNVGVAALAGALKSATTVLGPLDLKYNSISDATALGEMLKTNKTLRSLTLSHNDLTDAAPLVQQANSTLERLYLHHNKLVDIENLVIAVGNNTGLKVLELEGNNIKVTDAGARRLVAAITNENNKTILYSLNLNDCGIGDVGAMALGALFGDKEFNLYLDDNNIGNLGASTLAMALGDNRANVLRILSITGNPIGRAGHTALVEVDGGDDMLTLKIDAPVEKKAKEEDVEGALAVLGKARQPHTNPIQKRWANGGTLEFYVVLDGQDAKDLSILLRHNIIKPEQIALYGAFDELDRVEGGIGDAGATALAQALLKEDTTLESLIMTAQNIGADGATELADALANNTTLTKFEIFVNPIGDDGAAALARALKANKTLEHLDLDDCSIGDTGMAALAGGVVGHQALTSLYISRNKFGEQGVRAVATMLQTNTTLQLLQLSNNQIDDAGVAALAKALRSPTTVLGSLQLSNNLISDAAALGEMLETNEALHSLSLSHNDLTDAAPLVQQDNSTLRALYLGRNELVDNKLIEDLAIAVGNSTGLKTLQLDGNNIGDEGARDLAGAITNKNTQNILSYLSLNDCGIGDDGGAALGALFRDKRFDLHLTSNNIGDEGAASLARQLENNPQNALRELFLTDNPIGDEGKAALAKVDDINLVLRVD